jgi:hypothetical protein
MYHQFFSFWQETEQRFTETFIGTAKETELTLYCNTVLMPLAVWCSVMRRVAEFVPETSLIPPPSRCCRIYYSLTIQAYPSLRTGGMWWKLHERYPQPSYQFLFADVTLIKLRVISTVCKNLKHVRGKSSIFFSTNPFTKFDIIGPYMKLLGHFRRIPKIAKSD